MKKLIVKDNALINASYNLDLVEQRLILLAIVEARESSKGINANDPLTIHAESYSHQFGVHRNTAYQALKDACDGLFARQFSYQTLSEKGNIQNHKSRWVSEVVYIENEAIVKMIFAPAIIPLISRLEQQFTSYELEQVSSLTSAYAVRLYELLISWRSAGKTPFINLDELRRKLGVLDTEYKRMERFKASVLELAIKQINEHTDITVEYEQHKAGRTITGFSFTFKQKAKPMVEAVKAETRDPDTPDLFSGMTEKQITTFAAKLADMPGLSDLAEIGQTTAEFAAKLATILRDPTTAKPKTVARVNAALAELGFKN